MTFPPASAEQMRRKLRRTYLFMAEPAGGAIVLIEILRATGHFDGITLPEAASPEIPVFVFAVATSLALPVLYRSLFATAHRNRSTVPPDLLYRFENNSMGLAMVTPYCAVLSSIFSFDAFFTGGIFLLSLYAGYV
ncbi:MAG: hypothetical protein JXA28_09385, partial [Bacteroidetes bacterium]|nr:hypothetical protein [Bacteroidota bacterium]